MSIPVFRPCFDEAEVDAVREVLMSGWVGPGKKVETLEKNFAEYVGTRFALSMNSCSSALFAAMKILGVEDREVVTTAQTFVATNHAILQNGGKPVFADIDPLTLNIDPDSVANRVTDDTAAIVVVHHGGHPCDMDPINEIANSQNIPVVEDAAHAAGAKYKGRMVGSLGTIGCFSFHALKNMSTGDGGMLTTDDEQISERVKNLRWMGISLSTYERFRKNGRTRAWEYDIEEVGYKFHMNDLNAAIGIVQLGKLGSTNAARKEVAVQYRKAFKDLDWVKPLQEQDYAKSAHHAFVVLVEDRDRLIEHLADRGIDAGVHYRPNHLYSVYEPYRRSLPITESLWTRMVTLPLFPGMTNEDVSEVIKAVRDFKPSN